RRRRRPARRRRCGRNAPGLQDRGSLRRRARQRRRHDRARARRAGRDRRRQPVRPRARRRRRRRLGQDPAEPARSDHRHGAACRPRHRRRDHHGAARARRVKPTLTFVLLAAALLASAGRAADLTLQDDDVVATFDGTSGALVRCENRATHWAIERRPELGVSFRLHAPLPDRRDNFVLGAKQTLARAERLSDSVLRFTWKNLASEHGGALPITFTSTVALDHGRLTFTAALQNDSPLTVESIDYPYFG